jgi:hypothetical protein
MRAMNETTTPSSILQQIAQIQSMERGSLHRIGEGPQGPYYNLQSYENGKHVSRYVRQADLAPVQEAIEGFKRFEHLTGQYAQIMIERTRSERQGGLKKKRRNSSSPKTRKLSS